MNHSQIPDPATPQVEGMNSDAPSSGDVRSPHFHDTDCSEFLLWIYEYIDGEMGLEEHLRFEAHVKECAPCLRQHQVDQTVKGLIRRAEPPAQAPESLRAAIVARITTIQLELGS